MALRRIDKKKAVAARTVRPRAVAIAARQAYLARTQRNVPDDSVADPPESPAIQAASLVNLSVPTSQLTLWAGRQKKEGREKLVSVTKGQKRS
jgi:hypothetical protein